MSADVGFELIGSRNSKTKTCSIGKGNDSTDSVGTPKKDHQKIQNENNKETKWIRRKAIQARKCCRFVPTKAPSGRTEKVICGCGYYNVDHKLSCFSSVGTTSWTSQNDTETYLTDAFGEMQFVGFGQRYAKYIRVDVDTDTDVMWQLMTDVWGLKPPNLVISVTGGAKSFHMTSRLKDVFRKGLIKAALCTDAWITSSGTHAGVMKYVGEAVRDLVMGQTLQSGVVALGIAPWGCVQNKDALVQSGGRARYPIHTERQSGETPLDFNHTHFILVDDGTQHKFAVEIPFRAKLEKTISLKSSSHAGDSVKVPIILIVVEGGPGTLQTVYNSIKEQTPAVIIDGSGRAADILAYAVQNSYEHVFDESRKGGERFQSKAMEMDAKVEAEVKHMLSDVFAETNDKKLCEWIRWIKQCLLFPDLLTVFQLDSILSPKDIDIVMLQALLKANHEQVLEQLKLALIWNRVDVAKSDIFTEDRQFKSESLSEIMFSAILLNRVEFVKLFLENGVSLKDFLTKERLVRLYESIPQKCLLYDLLRKFKKNRHQEQVSLWLVGHLIRSLMGDFYSPIYIREEFESVTDSDFPEHLERPERDLFVWCVLMDRCEMAKVFWEEDTDSLPAALVANSLLRSMRQRTADYDLKQKLCNDAQDFQELAVGILRECHEDDEVTAMEVLIRPLNYWGKTNCISIAIESNNKEFIAQIACQQLFSTVWWGEMDTENGLQILPCILCPPLAVISMKFRQDIYGIPSDAGDENVTVKKSHSIISWGSRRTQSITSQRSESERSSRSRQLRASQKLRFFFQAPVTKFCYTVGSFLFFLILFSYVMLIDFHPNVLSVAEIVLIFWVGTMALEELRQLWKSSPGPAWVRVLSYLGDRWNILDVVTIALFTVGMVLRSVPHIETFTAAHIILAINLFTFFMRLLHIFSVSKIMGPKLVMIGRMLKDLVTFTSIMLVFIVGYGVTSQSILYPNTDLNKMLIVDVLKKAYWQMFAELFIDEIEGKEDCVDDMAAYTNGTHVRCPSEVGRVLVPILLAFYMLFMHVLILSLLIAVFTNTFEAVQLNTDLHWHSQRYKLVYEYYEKPALPPPFILLSHIWMIGNFFRAGCMTNVMYGFLSHGDDTVPIDYRSLELFEENKRDEFMLNRKQQKMETTDYRVATTAESVANLVTKVDEMQEELTENQTNSSKLSDSRKNTETKTLNKVTTLEKQVSKLQESMDLLLKSLGYVAEHLPAVPSIAIQTSHDNNPILMDEDPVKETLSPLLAKIPFFRQATSVETRNLSVMKSRSSPYPGTSINRTEVPDDKITWEDDFPEYDPVYFTSTRVQSSPLWADDPIEGSSYTWNSVDPDSGVNRVSYQGEYGVDDKGYPQNPIGRTGLCGRGCLGRWGPNHAADPIVTRWKLDMKGNSVTRDGKAVLEFVAVRRHDNKHWALPGGFIFAGEEINSAVRRRFVEETLAGDGEDITPEYDNLSNLLSHGTEIYRGYVDDERNTDNAWIETIAMHYHDRDGSFTRGLQLKAGKTEDAVAWLPVCSNIPMQANHCFILERVSEMTEVGL